jgi:hypothetical protein
MEGVVLLGSPPYRILVPTSAAGRGRKIKRPNGRIENWVRDLSRKLIAIRHLLTLSQTPGTISDTLEAIKAKAGGRGGTNNNASDARQLQRQDLRSY